MRDDSTARSLWLTVIIVTVLNVLYGLYSLFDYVRKNPISDGATVVGNVAVGIFTLIVLLELLYLWGMYRLDRWVVGLMWVGFVGSVVSFDPIGIIINGFVLFSYRRVLKAVYPTALKPAP